MNIANQCIISKKSSEYRLVTDKG